MRETLQDLVHYELETGDYDQEIVDMLSDFGDQSLDDLIDDLEPPPQMDESFPSTVVICNVPVVGEEKVSKLQGVLQKCTKNSEVKIEIPMTEKGGVKTTEGFAIVTFVSPEEAQNGCLLLDGFKLDKTHTFKVIPLDVFDQLVSRSDEFVHRRTIQGFSRADFRDWLADEKCREQFLLRYEKETQIYWHDTMVGQPVLCYGGEREKSDNKVWCDWTVMWSPQGSYIATFHAQGVAIWGGPEFEKKVRLVHKNVKEITFAPDEEHVLLWNGNDHMSGDDQAVAIYKILTGQCVKKCRTPAMSPTGEDNAYWSWSADGKYLAECSDSRILVRDSVNWDILTDEQGKRTGLKFEALKTFQWSPKDNIIAVWTLEKDNNPARLVLVSIPKRVELASRSRTQCEAELHWQSEGEYLCLLVTKLSKTRKRVGTNVEIFRVKEKNIPVDIVTIEDNVRGFFWESKGNRFAVLTADEAGLHPKLRLFILGKEKLEEICCFDLPSNSFNKVIWAPEGHYFVVASVSSASGASSSGDLLFCGLTPDNKLEILHKDEHFMCTSVQWDPSSRYVMTAVTQPMEAGRSAYKFSMEAGYSIWTFQGRKLFQQQKEALYAVNWRPHPPSQLPKARQDHIRKNIKQFSKKYDAMDDSAKETARQAFRAEREAKANSFRDILDRLRLYKEEKYEETGWDEAIRAFDEQQDWKEEQTFIEEELDVTENLIPNS